jgi:predicted ArsR family transcriptional regulator
MDESIKLTEPKAMRALAHPTRLALLGLLRQEGPLTATEAAARVGESSASCSFHLRQLAKYGFVEDAGGGAGRQRPWRATAAQTSWDDAADDPEQALAAQALSEVVASRYGERIAALVAARPSLPRAWRAASSFADAQTWLTAAELDALTDELEELVLRHADRARDPALRPPGSRRVSLLTFALPHPDAE